MPSVKYPLETHNGKLVTTDSPVDIAGYHIRHALETQLEELVMNPDFGLEDMVFDTVPLSTFLVAAREAIEKSLEGLPGVTFQVLGAQDDGTVYLSVIYQVSNIENTLEVTLNNG